MCGIADIFDTAGHRPIERGLFDMGFVGRRIEEHQSGPRDHTAPPWSLPIFEFFQRQCLRQAM